MVSSNILALSTAIVVVSFVLFSARNRRRSLPYPPGPPSVPFLGNYLSLPTRKPWVTYANWSKELQSGLISIQAFGQLTVIINSKKIAKELLEHRSAIYSSRPFPKMSEIMGWGFSAGLMPYSDRWRTQRRLLHGSFHSTVALDYRPLQRTRILELLPKLVSDSKNFADNMSSMAASIAIEVLYGDIGDESQKDRFRLDAKNSVSMLSDSMFPGAVAVNTLPFLRYLPGWLPGMGFKAFAAQCMEHTTYMQDVPWALAKRSVAENVVSPSMAAKLIADLQETSAGHDAEQDAKEACAAAYAAGADTTLSALSSSILALLLHPHVQRRAQQEIDDVVGRQRLPTFEDRANLPYVEAIYREVLRWNPVAPLSILRAAFEDDVYEGYFIPRGTSVIANAWAMMHDPVDYPEPESFKPERFITADGRVNDDDMRIAYGFGRRYAISPLSLLNQAW
ncbi:cytochrome P450 [Dentipellis sp. KUC8613]|nr:cytochrome P450 [Dentipellis sp. KUC8613]